LTKEEEMESHQGMADKRYSGISLEALRRSRTVLSRETDAVTGRSTWIAEMSGTGLRGSGLTRTEALSRVREAAAARHLALGGAGEGASPREGASPSDADGIGSAA
jgi:hypothetical protein